MSSALALVTPRPVAETSADARDDRLAAPRRIDVESATLHPTTAMERAAEEPSLAVVAQVPDMCTEPASKRAASNDSVSNDAVSRRSWKLHWNPNWKVPRPKFRLIYVKAAAALLHFDLAACWGWAISLPPIVKLGTVMASLVMSLWMFSGGKSDPPVETSPPAWHQDEETATSYSAAIDDAKSKSNVADDDRKPPADSSHVAEDQAGRNGPTIREIQDAARSAGASKSYDDRWPDEIAGDVTGDGRFAHAAVRPIPSHREPLARGDLPFDATPRDEPNGRQNERNAWRGDEGPQPPTDMPRRWAERPQPTQTSEYAPIRTNPYYADTAVARTPNRAADARNAFDRPAEDRYADRRFDDRRVEADRVEFERRTAERKAAEIADAERRDYRNNRPPAYNIGREPAEAQRPFVPETYRR
ncbi:MAG: hypothetical protein WD875_19030 [Pirellulales bacterium]